MLYCPFFDLGNPLTAVVNLVSSPLTTLLDLLLQSTRSTTPETKERDTIRLKVPIVACIL